MTQNKKNKLQAIIAIAFSVFVVGIAITLLIFDKIEGGIFATLIISSPLLGICIQRSEDIQELAFSKGASVKLQKAEEISDRTSELAEQLLLLLDPNPDEEDYSNDLETKAIFDKIRSLTSRAIQ